MREISIEGLKLIGSGANGKVYRLNDEQIVKVYNPLTNPYEKIEREKSVSKTAFIHGVPTAISFDIVRVGEEYGMVYEMIEAKTLGAAIEEDPGMAGEYAARMARLLKDLHHTSFAEGELPDGRLNLHAWADIAERSGYYPAEVMERMRRFIDDIPERNTFIHGDFHPGNIMLSKGEMLLIDMGDASLGHPVIDLLGSYQIMKATAERPGGAMRYMGMSLELAKEVWSVFIREYFETDDPERLAGLEQLLRFYCLIRTFPGITFSELLKEDERRALVDKVVKSFMKGADRVRLPF
ncbi:MAG: phosphotransferase [Lachnospiraceae bacterium]|nr:phosphotransferase [Lachnospiraceae bacterium]